MDSLKNKIALITGASSGIGAGTAIMFAKYGSRLALTGRNKERLEQVAEKCVQQGLDRDKILIMTADLRRDSDVTRLLQEVVSYFKTLDILVNNAVAGFVDNQPDIIGETTMAQYDEFMNVNVRAVVLLTKLAIPHLKANKGTVVNVSSVGSTRAAVTGGVYCMTKAAIDMFTSVLSLELGPVGVRVNSVNPGWVRTPMMETEATRAGVSYEKFVQDAGKQHPLQRCGTVEEVAQAIVFLASDSASFVTGANLTVDGGFERTASWFPGETAALTTKMNVQ